MEVKVVFVARRLKGGTSVQQVNEKSYEAHKEAYLQGGWLLATDQEIKEHFPDFPIPKAKPKAEKKEYPDQKRPGPKKK